MSNKKKRRFNDNNMHTQGNSKFFFKRVCVEPKSIGQRNYLASVEKNKLTICNGPAGCGKTYIAAACASNMLHKNPHIYDHIIIVRPAVTACNEKLGFLPGTLESKMEPFTMPVFYSLSKVVGRDLFMHLMKSDAIKVIPLAYMRGLTLDNCIILFDEAQNSTPEQMKMFLTRLGENCKVIIEGDVGQSDIRTRNGLTDAIERLNQMRDVGIVEMDRSDIVRSGFVRDVLERYSE